MNKYQFRAIRNSFQRDVIFSKGSEYNNNLLENPIMGKTIKDIILLDREGKKMEHTIRKKYELTKENNVFVSYYLDYNHISQNIYLITKNDKIIYWVQSSIFAPASSAWRHLTDVFHGYGTGKRNSSWTWLSTTDFDCVDHFWSKEYIKQMSNTFEWTMTEYQKEMLKKTGHYYIDKKIVSQKQINELAEKEYYHI